MDLYGPEAEELLEYEDRTMSSTWVISFDQVRKIDADAAELFKFWAFFSSKDLWYELIRAGAESGPTWMSRVTANKVRFDRAMARLQDYSLAEVTSGSYNIHPCIHTWSSAYFDTDQTAFLAALNCVARNIPKQSSPQYWSITRRLLVHINRLDHEKFRVFWQASNLDETMLVYSANSAIVYFNWGCIDQAEEMYMRALSGCEQLLGHNHSATLCTVSNLGLLYSQRDQLDKAEEMFLRALTGYEIATDSDEISTLNAVHNLGLVYLYQGKKEQAEHMLLLALEGTERILGREHPSALGIFSHLGLLYWGRRKRKEAEQMLLQALAGLEKGLGHDHPSTLQVVNNLGKLCGEAGWYEKAEVMLLRALAGREAALGPEHMLTLITIDDLGILYQHQGNQDKAEEMFSRVRLTFQNRPINFRLRGTVLDLTRTLNKSMRDGASDRHDAKCQFARLGQGLRLYHEMHGTDIIYYVARLLLCMKDKENALVAFVHRGAICNGCDGQANLEYGYYVCHQCNDTDLCSQCIAKYNDKSLKLTNCSEHEFFDVNAAIAESTKPFRRMSPEEMKEWADRLKEKYPVIDEHQADADSSRDHSSNQSFWPQFNNPICDPN